MKYMCGSRCLPTLIFFNPTLNIKMVLGEKISKICTFSDLVTIFFVTVNVLKLRTLKKIIFLIVRNFRNYVSEKVLVFVILECGLCQEQKR